MERAPAPWPMPKEAHPWLHKLRFAWVPGPSSPALAHFSDGLLGSLRSMGHTILPHPEEGPDVLLTTASFGEPLNWRAALLLTGRKRFHLERTPVVFTLLHVPLGRLHSLIEHFRGALAKEPPNPADFDFPGLAPSAYLTLYEQGRRGGPILSVIRLVQSQAKCIRTILFVGDDDPLGAYTFDLVGAHPWSEAIDLPAFYQDLALRIATAASTAEVTEHQVLDESLTQGAWRALKTPRAMIQAGQELGRRGFFTEMVQVNSLVNVPAVHEAVSSQYSEGCYATWEPALDALIVTVTGSARPVDKDKLTEDELAIISGVRPDLKGALVRQVSGKLNDPPSSEAVEMMEMDAALPRQQLDRLWVEDGKLPPVVPVVRSKLHGHRGVRSYDPQLVEHVWLEAPYYHYPVSCATEAQAHAIRTAFARSQALREPQDPRQVVFTLLAGHGVVITEKWVTGKVPFQAIWEAMDSGALEIDNLIPQGPFVFRPDETGRMKLWEEGVPTAPHREEYLKTSPG